MEKQETLSDEVKIYFEELGEKCCDRLWRLNNLYHIQDKKGNKVLFKLNKVQSALLQNSWFLNIILKSRQHGISTFIEILILDYCLFNSNTSAGIIADTLDNAKGLLKKIHFAYNNLPIGLQELMKADVSSKTEIVFNNGSAIKVGTSMRSGTVQLLHISEFGKICAKTPDKAEEIVTGALEAVQVGQYIFIESTAEGQEGYFYDYCKKAEDLKKLNKQPTKLDYRFFFFAWYEDEENELDSEGVIIPEHLEKYFEELETKHSIKLNDRKKAWYTKKEEKLKDKIFREHPSIPDEAFKASVDGAYYSNQFTIIRKENRITRLPILTDIQVDTWWDLGVNDFNTIWFTQKVPHEYIYRVIDYYENSGEGLSHYMRVLKDKGYNYGFHVAPHDIDVQEWGTGISRKQTASNLGLNFEVVKRTNDLMNDIEIVRNFLANCVFDEKRCQLGIIRLENYRKAWDENLGTHKNYPIHDKNSHGADGFRTLAIGSQMFKHKNLNELDNDFAMVQMYQDSIADLSG